jgi:hypothetical protein
VYCYNNPVKFVDPDGRELVDPEGEKITYSIKNGWSSNVDHSTLRIGEAMMQTPEGRKSFMALQKSDAKIRMMLSDEVVYGSHGGIKEGHVGKTKNGIVPLIVYLGSVKERVRNINESADAIKRGGTIKSVVSERIKLLLETQPTENQRIGQVAGHEAEHILNPEAQTSSYNGIEDKSEEHAIKKEIDLIKQTPFFTGKIKNNEKIKL